MKYRAKPVEVTAFRIVTVSEPDQYGLVNLDIDNGQTVVATPEMLARINPVPEDYYVVQEDGYVYINPKAVFERKYEAILPPDPNRPVVNA